MISQRHQLPRNIEWKHFFLINPTGFFYQCVHCCQFVELTECWLFKVHHVGSISQSAFKYLLFKKKKKKINQLINSLLSGKEEAAAGRKIPGTEEERQTGELP